MQQSARFGIEHYSQEGFQIDISLIYALSQSDTRLGTVNKTKIVLKVLIWNLVSVKRIVQ